VVCSGDGVRIEKVRRGGNEQTKVQITCAVLGSSCNIANGFLDSITCLIRLRNLVCTKSINSCIHVYHSKHG
jgi:hypothetical protein